MEIPYNLALEIFGLKESPSESDINKSYHRLVKCAHPDKGGDEKLFCFIAECKSVLLEGKSSKTTNQQKQEKKEQDNNKTNSTQSSKKNYYISLSDLYDMYYSLGQLQQEFNIDEIRLNSKLYIYPKRKKHLQRVIALTAWCPFSDFSKFGYVPLKSAVYLPEDFSKYKKFSIRFEFLDKTFKTTITANSLSTFKLHRYRFNTLLEMTLIKSNG